MDIREKIKDLPSAPGVYIMKDESGRILYVGKAGNLKKRVSSYFRPYGHLSERLMLLVSQARSISFIPTGTEAEALIYENSLIKEYSPKYNVALKDDKSYPYLKLTVNEKFPRLFITRQKRPDGAAYFGPYTNVKLLRGALGILKRVFPLRRCNKMPRDLCLEYHIKQCVGPCAGKVNEALYKGMVSELKLFLEGKRKELITLVTEKMREASKQENYEEAARLRDMLEMLSVIKEDTLSYSPHDEIEELGRVLSIRGTITVIEAFDVSNIMGKEAVGSMVSFYKGRPKKSGYKRFKIKTVFRPNDYEMMRELVKRRYARVLAEKGGLPDIIVIDGGRGHLSAAGDELKKMGLPGIPIIGIAKEFEHIYVKDKTEPIILPKESKALHLLKRVRDEAHRFAIAYHKLLMSKRVEISELDNIAGIGRKRKNALLSYFGSMEMIKKAPKDELSRVEGMNEKAAGNIIEYFGKRPS